MTDISDIQHHVRTYITDWFLTDVEAAALQNDSDLLKILDSLQILRLVIAMEGAFAIKVADDELMVANLGSVEKIAMFIARKSAGSSQVVTDRSPT
jgi:acyl carrier protein